MKRKNNLLFEEAVLDDLAEGRLDRLESPLSDKAFRFVAVAVFLLVASVFARVLFLGGVKGSFYGERAMVNAGETEIVRPERGTIFDRFGSPLTKNLPSFRLNLALADFLKLPPEDRERAIKKAASLIGVDAEQILNNISQADLEKQNSLVIGRKITLEQTIKINELNLPFLKIEEGYEREYPEGSAFSHILGYTGAVSKSDLGSENKSFFGLNDIVGKTGLEATYDDFLRGQNGRTVNYRNARGEVIEKKLFTEPERGESVYSSIDAELQKYFFSRLQTQIKNLGSKAGVGIVMNPQNGSVLALVNVPSYDNNEILVEDLSSSSRPLFNRAISGSYTPGSTIKIIDAFAALKEKIISPDDKIFSAGYIEIPNPYHPDQPSRFPDWKAHGWVDMYSAIARSSNVYFYEIGGGYEGLKGLGLDRLKKYWRIFGLGEKTGIDLPAEASGSLPDMETKEKLSGEPWRIGDTYNVSIGQGDLTITPIQLLSYVSAFGNKGKIYRPRLIEKIVGRDGKTDKEIDPQITIDLSTDGDLFEVVRRGMVDTVEKSYGTAHMLADLPISSAGKTGSSQVENKTKINAFFVGFAPKEDPEIAILVLVEDAREGSMNAVPVARDVLEWYYYHRIKSSE